MPGSPINHRAQQQLVWLITGTTAGLGKSLVSAALQRGDRVIATARASDRLFEVDFSAPQGREANLRRLQLDVTESEESLRAKVDEAATYWGRIDVLANNAGYGQPGYFEEGRSEMFQRQFEVNVFGMVKMTTVALPHLRASQGWVVNIGSRSAWKTEVAGLSSYTASKAAVHALSETLAMEVAPFGVKVLVVAPGAFRTEGMYELPYMQTQVVPAYHDHREASAARFKSVPGTEKGDPARGMALVVDVVRGEGRAAGRETPRLLLLGEDAVRDVVDKSHRTLALVEDWKDVNCDVHFQ